MRITRKLLFPYGLIVSTLGADIDAETYPDKTKLWCFLRSKVRMTLGKRTPLVSPTTSIINYDWTKGVRYKSIIVKKEFEINIKRSPPIMLVFYFGSKRTGHLYWSKADSRKVAHVRYCKEKALNLTLYASFIELRLWRYLIKNWVSDE